MMMEQQRQRRPLCWCFMVTALLLLLLCCDMLVVVSAADVDYPDETMTKLAFGSCHKNYKAVVGENNIWNRIGQEHADAFVWTGDAIYPTYNGKRKVSALNPWDWKEKYGPATLQTLKMAYMNMLKNKTIGYKDYVEEEATRPRLGVWGTWDDHDYGGNDMGNQMPQRQERKKAFYEFLQMSNTNKEQNNDNFYHLKSNDKIRNREGGVYSSVTWGDASKKNKVHAIFLDTRWGRDPHCIRSTADVMPLGNAIACGLRWLTAGFRLDVLSWIWRTPKPSQHHQDGASSSRFSNLCYDDQVLEQDQWAWLQEELDTSDAQIILLVSSIQVLTTNPAMESWGHHPSQQQKLLQMIYTKYTQSNIPILIMSGDVHHGEISAVHETITTSSSSSNNQNYYNGIMEVTSSGLTHSCSQPKLYGHMCDPLLRTFHKHRLRPNDYYISLNYGVLTFHWQTDDDNMDNTTTTTTTTTSTGSFVQVEIKNSSGTTVIDMNMPLSPQTTTTLNSKDNDFTSIWENLPHTFDGHLFPWLKRLIVTIIAIVLLSRKLFFRNTTSTTTTT